MFYDYSNRIKNSVIPKLMCWDLVSTFNFWSLDFSYVIFLECRQIVWYYSVSDAYHTAAEMVHKLCLSKFD